MRLLITLLLTLLIAGCENPTSDPYERLAGTWFSSKELSLLHSDLSGIEAEKLKFLKENLGELGFRFKHNTMTMLLRSDPFAPRATIEFEITHSTDHTLTIKPEGGRESTYTFEGECYFLNSGRFREYFCKEATADSQK